MQLMRLMCLYAALYSLMTVSNLCYIAISKARGTLDCSMACAVNSEAPFDALAASLYLPLDTASVSEQLQPILCTSAFSNTCMA